MEKAELGNCQPSTNINNNLLLLIESACTDPSIVNNF